MKNRYYFLWSLLAMCTILLNSCMNIDEMGEPKPLKLRVESETYQVQVTPETLTDTAFIYRWIQSTGKYVITLGDLDAEKVLTLDATAPNLTYNQVAELPVKMSDVIEALKLTQEEVVPGQTYDLQIAISDGRLSTITGEPLPPLISTVSVVIAKNVVLP